ncbi:hypothetical protein Q3G72_023550 [Acer saccharum]|nr:hypothetical protein Q3G72_023550 [Acer saccharum]
MSSQGGTNINISVLQSIGRLTSLDTLSLSNCNLEGTLPDQGGLCELVHLRELYLYGNNLKGALPSCFGNLTSLQVLSLSHNQFSGNISLSPLMALISIQELYLSYNHFQIPISLEPFFNHSKLKSFTCKNTDLYAETELHSLAPKFQLNSIKMSGCKGTFPKFLYHQHDLQEVDLSHNNFTGVFPYWLVENNTQLLHLVLLNNSLTGSLPLPIHSHLNLMTLDISLNNFNGHIPAEVGAYLPRLEILNLSKNALEGNIPSSIGDMKSLISLDLSHNHLSGEIPEHLAEGCFVLQFLVLSNNSLQGQIFSSNFKLTNLLSLQLDGNNFSGKIPDSLSNTSNLRGLYLSDNQLSGKIPGWLGNMSRLIELVMPNNHLEGPIPPEFCQLENLKVLNLVGNSISEVPSCFGPSSLKQVHLSRNMLQGELQDSFRNSSSLVTLDLGYNRINGSIPNWIGRLFNLTYLILNNNNLQGRVPIQLCQLARLRLIDLSHNNLSGNVPRCLMTALHDGDFDVPAPIFSVAYNNLSGRTLGLVAQFSTFNASSYKGNPLLCGLPLPKSCDPIESPTLLPTDSNDIGEENDFMDMDIFYISFTVTYAIVLLAIVAVLLINPYWRRTWFYVVETWMTSFYYFIVDHLPKCHYI